MSYLKDILDGLKSMGTGMKSSGKHMLHARKKNEPLGIENPEYFNQSEGPITIEYPHARVPVPDTGRYRLHMETDDCIGCDKCARICPVDCITIETFRADGDLGSTSDGTVKRLHLPVFDIDMGKCMYCGLCTTVCPTECLIMTKVYDYSEYDRDNFVYHFGAMSPEDEETVRKETEVALAKKKAEKAAKAAAAGTSPGAKKRPVVRRKPVVAPGKSTPDTEEDSKEAKKFVPKRRPVMKRKPVVPPAEEGQNASTGETPQTEDQAKAPNEEKKKFVPRRRPVMKRKPAEESGTENLETPNTEDQPETPTEEKKKFVPRRRPVMKRKPAEENKEESGQDKSDTEEGKEPPA